MFECQLPHAAAPAATAAPAGDAGVHIAVEGWKGDGSAGDAAAGAEVVSPSGGTASVSPQSSEGEYGLGSQ